MESVKINRNEIIELARLINEINDRIESLELMSDPEFVESFRKSKEQIAKGELGNFDDL